MDLLWVQMTNPVVVLGVLLLLSAAAALLLLLALRRRGSEEVAIVILENRMMEKIEKRSSFRAFSLKVCSDVPLSQLIILLR